MLNSMDSIQMLLTMGRILANRYLSIEHFFSDELLQDNGLKGDSVIADSKVFEIEASSKAKVAFAEKAKDFEATEFNNFALLFDRISDIQK